MLRLVASSFAALLIVHGLIHLMGTVVYVKPERAIPPGMTASPQNLEEDT